MKPTAPKAYLFLQETLHTYADASKATPKGKISQCASALCALPRSFSYLEKWIDRPIARKIQGSKDWTPISKEHIRLIRIHVIAAAIFAGTFISLGSISFVLYLLMIFYGVATKSSLESAEIAQVIELAKQVHPIVQELQAVSKMSQTTKALIEGDRLLKEKIVPFLIYVQEAINTIVVEKIPSSMKAAKILSLLLTVYALIDQHKANQMPIYAKVDSLGKTRTMTIKGYLEFCMQEIMQNAEGHIEINLQQEADDLCIRCLQGQVDLISGKAQSTTSAEELFGLTKALQWITENPFLEKAKQKSDRQVFDQASPLVAVQDSLKALLSKKEALITSAFARDFAHARSSEEACSIIKQYCGIVIDPEDKNLQAILQDPHLCVYQRIVHYKRAYELLTKYREQRRHLSVMTHVCKQAPHTAAIQASANFQVKPLQIQTMMARDIVYRLEDTTLNALKKAIEEKLQSIAVKELFKTEEEAYETLLNLAYQILYNKHKAPQEKAEEELRQLLTEEEQIRTLYRIEGPVTEEKMLDAKEAAKRADKTLEKHDEREDYTAMALKLAIRAPQSKEEREFFDKMDENLGLNLISLRPFQMQRLEQIAARRKDLQSFVNSIRKLGAI